MIAKRTASLPSLLCVLVIAACGSGAHAAGKGTVSDRQTRQAAEAGAQLDQICQRANFTASALTRCAEAMSAHCAALRIDPASNECWQWMVKAHRSGRLDYQRVFSPQQKARRK